MSEESQRESYSRIDCIEDRVSELESKIRVLGLLCFLLGAYFLVSGGWDLFIGAVRKAA